MNNELNQGIITRSKSKLKRLLEVEEDYINNEETNKKKKLKKTNVKMSIEKIKYISENKNENSLNDSIELSNDNFIEILSNNILNNRKYQNKINDIIDSHLKYESDSYATSDTSDEDEEDIEYITYLNKLSKKDRKKIKNIEENIKNLNKSNIPLRAKILQSDFSLHIKSLLINKYEQLIKMETGDSEYFKLNKYMDNIFRIPFNKYVSLPINKSSTKNEMCKYFDNIRSNLDSCIYGQIETKNKLLEIVAKWVSNPKSNGNIIGLCGPPGIGKTTIIKKGLSEALGLPFSFIPLGGATSSSFLEGHDYTYEGSNWGKIVSTLMDKKCMNPIIFFDELDKVSETKAGEEIIGLLTHLTDLSQNSSFNDRYFSGIPIDLSKTLFIFSFNDENKINPILKDRINIIKLGGFNLNDKTKIALDYSIPTICKNIGIKTNDYIFEEDTIKYIINNYSKEKGIRTLNKCIETILMKLNLLDLSNNKISNIHSLCIKKPLSINIDIASKLLKNENNNKNDYLFTMYT